MTITATVALILTMTGSPAPATSMSDMPWESKTPHLAVYGDAAFYDAHVMEKTAVNRGLIKSKADYQSWLESEGYIGAVALYRKLDLMRTIWIRWPDESIDGPYIAIDVVGKAHYELGIERGRIVDVDYLTAERHNMDGPIPVTIVFLDSAINERQGEGRWPYLYTIKAMTLWSLGEMMHAIPE